MTVDHNVAPFRGATTDASRKNSAALIVDLLRKVAQGYPWAKQHVTNEIRQWRRIARQIETTAPIEHFTETSFNLHDLTWQLVYVAASIRDYDKDLSDRLVIAATRITAEVYFPKEEGKMAHQ